MGSESWVTNPTTGLTDDEVSRSQAEYGPNEIPVHVTPVYLLFVRQFTGFVSILIDIAAIISIAVLDCVDFAIVLVILVVSAVLGFCEEHKAKKSLDELASKMESEIAVIRNGATNSIPTAELVPGDVVVFLVAGDVIPADSKWICGDVMSVDTAALIGEPIPRYVHMHASCFAAMCHCETDTVERAADVGAGDDRLSLQRLCPVIL